jgi:hypothetical protein
MRYKPLKEYPEFHENPFMNEHALSEITENSIRKRVFIKGNRTVINHVVTDNGEVVAHSAFYRNTLVDEEKFVSYSSQNLRLSMN